jgi:hypothetical protein
MMRGFAGSFRRRLGRWVARGVLAAQLLSLAPPSLLAASEYPTGDSRNEYLSDVQERVSLRKDLEDRWRQARYRRRQIETAIDQIRSEEAPSGADMTEWYRERSARIRWLDDYLRRNEDNLIRYQANLGDVYDRLDGDRRFLQTTEDQQLKQALGSLVGIAGVAGIPIAARPMLVGGAVRATPGQPPPAARASVTAKGSIKGGGRIDTRVASSPFAPPKRGLLSRIRGGSTPKAPTNPKAPTSTTPATQGQARASATGTQATGSQTAGAKPAGTQAAGTKPAGTAGARPGAAPTGQGANAANMQGSPRAATSAADSGWRTDINKKGNVVLRRGDRVIDTGDKATVKDGKGRKAPEVRNEAAWNRAEGLRQMYTTRDQAATAIRDLKAQAKSAPKDARKSINQEIKRLQGEQKQLNKDIKTAEKGERSPSAAKNMVKSAAKWALFSTALTVSMRAIDQLRENDWDVSSIDWSDAVAPLKTPEFWGGTAGSFGLSMLASAVIPGGTWLKTLGAIGGAAVGWQIGSGNLRHTDWGELGASTLGSTIGTILGSALGPVGAFLGGLAGHFLATWALGKIRDWLEEGSTAYSSDDRQVVDLDGDVTPYAGGGRSRDGPSAPTGDAATIKLRMDQIYRQIEALMRDPNAGPAQRAQMAVLHQEYDGLFQQLENMRASADGLQGVGSWNE